MRGLVEAGADVAQQAIAFAQRDRVRFGRTPRALDEAHELRERRLLRLHERFTAICVSRCLAGRQRFADRGKTGVEFRCRAGRVVQDGGVAARLTTEGLPPGRCRAGVVRGRQGFGF